MFQFPIFSRLSGRTWRKRNVKQAKTKRKKWKKNSSPGTILRSCASATRRPPTDSVLLRRPRKPPEPRRGRRSRLKPRPTKPPKPREPRRPTPLLPKAREPRRPSPLLPRPRDPRPKPREPRPPSPRLRKPREPNVRGKRRLPRPTLRHPNVGRPPQLENWRRAPLPPKLRRPQPGLRTGVLLLPAVSSPSPVESRQQPPRPPSRGPLVPQAQNRGPPLPRRCESAKALRKPSESSTISILFFLLYFLQFRKMFYWQSLMSFDENFQCYDYKPVPLLSNKMHNVMSLIENVFFFFFWKHQMLLVGLSNHLASESSTFPGMSFSYPKERESLF